MVLFEKNRIHSKQQFPIPVYFNEVVVGDYFADILVDEKIILELKTVEKITDIHRAQALNYLKATNLRLAIIINFKSESMQYERMIL